MKVAVVLFNLGGPANLDAVEPFLRNLFADPAILPLPAVARLPLARFIAARRAPVAREIYGKLGGSSPILRETEVQARALERKLASDDCEPRVFIAMAAAPPFATDAAQAIGAWGADRIVLLPLYPQFSTTTTASSATAWRRAAAMCGLDMPTSRICCYPWEPGFVAAEAELLTVALGARRADVAYRVLFSAHGLPRYVVSRGDPYPWQVERCVDAIVSKCRDNFDWRLCFQSRVGPLKWLEPSTDGEIRVAARDGMGLIVIPIAFVSEHSETLVELDIEYAGLARECGAPDYIRVPTVSAHETFIDALAALVRRALASDGPVTCGKGRICPASAKACGYELRT